MIAKLLIGFLPKLFLGLLDRWGWRRAGIEAERRRSLESVIERGKQAREARRKAHGETDGMSDADIVARLRERDGDWHD